MRFSILRMLIFTAFLAVWLTLGYWSETFIGWCMGFQTTPPTTWDSYVFGPIAVVALLLVIPVIIGVCLGSIYGGWMLSDYVGERIKKWIC